LLMQIRSEGVRVGRLAGIIPQPSAVEKFLNPLLEQARAITNLHDPRGLYSYCWCREPR
jgi:hypothetical protein